MLLAALLLGNAAHAMSLTPTRLGVLYNLDEPDGAAKALAYAQLRSVPLRNLTGAHMGNAGYAATVGFDAIRKSALERLPSSVESLLLIWSRPWAVGCMSVTSAFAAGYQPGFCEPGCEDTTLNPLFDAEDWRPVETVGWRPAMLLPAASVADVRRLTERGVAADGSAPQGTVYLVTTEDGVRNIRAATYPRVAAAIGTRVGVRRVKPAPGRRVDGVIGYFTGAIFVDEMPGIHFLPGAVADHLTSSGGILDGQDQMSASAWLRQGATATYGTVTEPCAVLDKFPDIQVLMTHYLRGDTILEAYWKSVRMPGQGLFIGEPLARPFRH